MPKSKKIWAHDGNVGADWMNLYRNEVLVGKIMYQGPAGDQRKLANFIVDACNKKEQGDVDYQRTQPTTPMTKPSSRAPRMPYCSGAELEAIIPAIEKFEQEIWFKAGVKGQIKLARERGQSGTAGRFNVVMHTCAGRTMITLLDGNQWLTLMVAQDSEKLTMGLHERSIPASEIVSWLEHAANKWDGVTDDKNVVLDIPMTLY